MGDEGRLPLAALGLAIAAGLSSWNPLAAPFGLVVAIGAIVLAARALRRGARRRAALAALGIAIAAGAASIVVLARTAGVGSEPGGTPILQDPDRADARSELDAAAERTRAARERARSELEGLGGPAEPGRGRPGPPERR